jgi:serine/threonine protein kinase
MTLLWHVWLAPLQSKGLHMYTEGNLAQVLSKRGFALSEREACCMLVVPMLVTLWHLSQHSVLHGDIKPENIFMSDGQAFLGDFGLSRRLFVRVTTAYTVLT